MYSRADLIHYDLSSKPLLTLEEALKISKRILKISLVNENMYPYNIDLYGRKKENGGVWTVYFSDENKNKIQVSILFPEDKCIILKDNPVGKPIERIVNRNGAPLAEE